MTGWQPIETAPREGTEFQSWVVSEVDASRGWWEPKCRFEPCTGGFEVFGRVDYDQEGWDSDWSWKPTHWMPEPLPPAPDRLQGEDVGV